MIKAEVVRFNDPKPRGNPRLVAANLCHAPRFVYEQVNYACGDIEHRIKGLLDGLQIDRCRFWADQLRGLMTAAAYLLMWDLRLRTAATARSRTARRSNGPVSAPFMNDAG